MAQVNIISGIYTNSQSRFGATADFRTAYPINLMVVPGQTGLSDSYLRPADGIIQYATGPGTDRGGIKWNGLCYRVMGTKLILVNPVMGHTTTTTLGDVGAGGLCTFGYSFDRLAVSSGGRFYYYYSGVLTQVTDVDLGNVVDFVWVDGYFMTTDGAYLVVTELSNPFSVNPLKYGSSEVSPDPIVCLLKLKDEVYAINRYTIEVFQNVGGSGFPFQRIPGAMIPRGSVGAKAAALFLDNIAFVGNGISEAPSVWLGSNGQCVNISTREIDTLLGNYEEITLTAIHVETRAADFSKLLYIHLPDYTLVYDAAASKLLQQPIWTILSSSLLGVGKYRARNFVWAYNAWIVGDPDSNDLGYCSPSISSHYGAPIGWSFFTPIIYNGGAGAIFNELELVCLTGRVDLGITPTIWTAYSTDGVTWSQEKPRLVGTIGDTLKRIKWFQQGFMHNWRVQYFRGTSDARLAIARLEIKLEALNG